MRKVGNMRVPESTHKSKEQLQFERDQREGMLQYIEQMEEQYKQGKAGMAVLEEDEKDFPDEKKEKTSEGESLIYGIMCQREEDKESGKWYAIGYTYSKQKAAESHILITAMNNMVEPRYDIKIIAIKEKDWLEGYGASWQEQKVEAEKQKENAQMEGERSSLKGEELQPIIPDDIQLEQPKHEATPQVAEED